jgi:hypothetical protein
MAPPLLGNVVGGGCDMCWRGGEYRMLGGD